MRAPKLLDVAVVGAGPCGIAVGVAARQEGLSCALFDRGAVTRSVERYPTYTTFFSGPEKLEIADLPFTTSGDKPTRREALRYYRKVVEYFKLDVRQYENVERIAGAAGNFRLHTRGKDGAEVEHCARTVVIATGYFDTPNRLDVPGANLPKVVYYFHEPFPYFQQDVLVVGGGNSAADAALACWREGARVTMVHLEAQLDRGIKPWVRPDLENRIAEGAIAMLFSHRATRIGPGTVEIEDMRSGTRRTLPNDWVLAMTGYQPEPGLLTALGVNLDRETGVPAHNPATMETNVAGVYVAGVIVSGFDANKIFIENGKLHGALIASAVGDRPGRSTDSPVLEPACEER